MKISLSRDIKDKLVSGTGGWKNKLAGAKEYQLEVEWEKGDPADLSGLDAALYAAWDAGDPITWSGQMEAGGPSPQIPTFSGSVVLPDWEVGGQVGEKHTHSTTFQGSGAITRATA